MENKTGVRYLPFMVFCLVAMCIGFFGNVYILTYKESFPFLHFAAALAMLAIVFGVYYVLSGFRKTGAKFFTRFLHFYAMAEFAAVIYAASLTDSFHSIVGVAVRVIIFALILTLATGKDLGKVRSVAISGTALALNLFMQIATLAAGITSGFDAQGRIFALYAASGVALSVTMFAAVLAKYTDKDERGTK